MKLEELTFALGELNIDPKVSDGILRKLERLEDAMKLITKMEKVERSNRILERAEGYDNGYANGLRDGKAKEPEYFTVLETCKEDMRYRFGVLPEVIAKIDKLTDEQMEEIAIDIGDQLVKHYGEALELAVKAELEEGQ